MKHNDIFVSIILVLVIVILFGCVALIQDKIDNKRQEMREQTAFDNMIAELRAEHLNNPNKPIHLRNPKVNSDESGVVIDVTNESGFIIKEMKIMVTYHDDNNGYKRDLLYIEDTIGQTGADFKKTVTGYFNIYDKQPVIYGMKRVDSLSLYTFKIIDENGKEVEIEPVDYLDSIKYKSHEIDEIDYIKRK